MVTIQEMALLWRHLYHLVTAKDTALDKAVSFHPSLKRSIILYYSCLFFLLLYQNLIQKFDLELYGIFYTHFLQSQ